VSWMLPWVQKAKENEMQQPRPPHDLATKHKAGWRKL